MTGTFSLDEVLAVTFALFGVIDILGSVPVIISLRQKLGHIQTGKASIAAMAFMLAFLFFGKSLLRLLGVDVSSFAVAGSIVIFLIGLEMILGIDFFRPDPDVKAGSVVPVAFPIIAGSGTLTTIMTLKADYNFYSILIGILINCLIIFIVLESTTRIEKLLGKAGLLVIRKFFGVILLAIAVKIFRSNVGV